MIQKIRYRFAAFILLLPMLAPIQAIAQPAAQREETTDALLEDSWNILVSTLKKLPAQTLRAPESTDPGYKADFYLTSLMLTAQAALAVAQQDPYHPDWIPFSSKSIPILAPNPDNVYYVSRIGPGGIYRLTGNRGTTKIVDIQVSQGLWGLVDRPSPTILNIDLDSLKINDDGTFVLILSAERPVGFSGNWIRLDPKADHLFVRQLAYDWQHEEDARFAIERLDVPAKKERPSDRKIGDAFVQSAKFVERLMDFNRANHLKVHRLPPNSLQKLGAESNAAALNSKQAYYQGWVSVGDGEAIVLESSVPKCRYWSLQLADNWGNSIDYMHRQSSLNGGTAMVDPDGRLRVVLSPQDPGVPNWLDTSGYPTSVLLTRWYGCEAEPEQTLHKVSFTQVRDGLAPGTAFVDASTREANLRARVVGAQLRRRW